MTLIRRRDQDNIFDPFKDLLEHPQFGLSLVPFGARVSDNKEGWFPALDVSEDKEHNIVVKADLPGLKKEEISVALDNTVLTIRGERKSETEKQDKNFYRMERSYGTFERSIDLGVPVDEAKISARYKDGVLELVLPRVEQSKKKQIEIKND